MNDRSETASAQASEVAGIKEILARQYKRWHDSKGGGVESWLDMVDNNIQFGSLAEGMPAATFTARVNGRQDLKRYFDGLRDGWEMIHYTVDDLIVDGDRAVAVGSTACVTKKQVRSAKRPRLMFGASMMAAP